jgi:hypothetical protein
MAQSANYAKKPQTGTSAVWESEDRLEALMMHMKRNDKEVMIQRQGGRKGSA